MSREKNLISPEYKLVNQKLHDSKNYGEQNHGINEKIVEIFAAISRKNLCNSILDYGCGKGLLIKKLSDELGQSFKISGYDPGNSEYDNPYSPADIVTCFDVLEHVEPKKIDSVLNDISTQTIMLFIGIIDLLPAQKSLPDGRNAHLLIAPPGWWLDKLSQTFKSGHYRIFEAGNLNKKICYVGTNNTKFAKLACEVFSRAFY